MLRNKTICPAVIAVLFLLIALCAPQVSAVTTDQGSYTIKWGVTVHNKINMDGRVEVYGKPQSGTGNEVLISSRTSGTLFQKDYSKSFQESCFPTRVVVQVVGGKYPKGEITFWMTVNDQEIVRETLKLRDKDPHTITVESSHYPSLDHVTCSRTSITRPLEGQNPVFFYGSAYDQYGCAWQNPSTTWSLSSSREGISIDSSSGVGKVTDKLTINDPDKGDTYKIFALCKGTSKPSPDIVVQPTAEDGKDLTLEADGTYVKDSLGSDVFGFSSNREDTESEKRGDDDPLGSANTIGYTPLELFTMGTDIPDIVGTGANISRKTACYNITSTTMGLSALYANSGSNYSNDSWNQTGAGACASVDWLGCGRQDIAFLSKNHLEIISSVTGNTIASLTLNSGLNPDDYNQMDLASLFHITTGDFDGDKKQEIAIFCWKNSTCGQVRIYKMDASLNLTQVDAGPEITTKEITPVSLISGDWNHDQQDEIIYAYSTEYHAKGAPSYLSYIAYDNKDYKDTSLGLIKIGPNQDPLGMTGLALGDIDNDGDLELVLGGYMVNHDATGNTYVNHDGQVITYYNELALAFKEYSRINGPQEAEGFTVLMDDLGNAGTTGSELNEHHPADTKLYDTDTECKWSKYVNTCNWTIPMAAVSLSGYKNSATWDQIFFGMWFYAYDLGSGSFQVYSNQNPYENIDNNNISITNLTAGVAGQSEDSQTLAAGKEELLMAAALDKNKKNGSDVYYQVFQYIQNGDDGTTVGRSSKDLGTSNYYDKGYYPRVCFGNYDEDTILIRYIGHSYVLSEPYITAICIAPPYFEDIDLLEKGYDPGSTALNQFSGSGKEEECGGGVEVKAQWGGDKNGRILRRLLSKGGGWQLDFGAKFSGSDALRDTTEYNYGFTTSEGQDSVVLQCTPIDLYYYEACSAGEDEWEPMVASYPNTPVTKMIDAEKYDAKRQEYNEKVKKYNETYADQENPIGYLPDISSALRHTKGQPETYHIPKGMVADNRIDSTSSISTNYGASEQNVSVRVDHEYTSRFTFDLSVSLMRDTMNFFRLGFFVDEFGLEGSYEYSTSTISFSGSEFEIAMKSLPAAYNDYGYTMNMYVGSLALPIIDPDGNQVGTNPITIVGPNLSNTKAAPKLVDFKASDLSLVEGQEYKAAKISFRIPDLSEATTSDSLTVLRQRTAVNGTAIGSATDLTEKLNQEAQKMIPGSYSFTDSDLDPNSTYRYTFVSKRTSGEENSISQSITTAAAPEYAVSFDSNDSSQGVVLGRYVDKKKEVHRIVSGANVPRESTLDLLPAAKDGYQFEKWSYTYSADGENSTSKTSADMVLTIDSIKGPVTAQAIFKESPVTSIEFQLSDEKGKNGQAWHTSGSDSITIETTSDKGVTFRYYAQTSQGTAGTAKDITDKTIPVSELAEGEQDLVVEAVNTANAVIGTETLHVKKDTTAPKLSLSIIDSRLKGRMDIVPAITVGPSGIKSLEVKESSVTDGQWVDVTKSYHNGITTFSNGTYQVRLTSGNGLHTTKSIDVTGNEAKMIVVKDLSGYKDQITGLSKLVRVHRQGDDLINAFLTEEQQDQGGLFWAKVKISTQGGKAAVKALKSQGDNPVKKMKLGIAYDLEITQTNLDMEDGSPVSQLLKPLDWEVAIPDELLVSGRQFQVFCQTDDQISLPDTVQSANKLLFETDQLTGTFGILYTDPPVSENHRQQVDFTVPSANSGSGDSGSEGSDYNPPETASNSHANGPGGRADTGAHGSKVKTDDPSPATWLLLYAALLLTAGLTMLVIFLRRRQ